MELAVYVTTYLGKRVSRRRLDVAHARVSLSPHPPFSGTPYRDRCRDCDDIALLYEKLAGFVADLADLGFGYRATGAQLRNGPAVGKKARG